MKQFGWLGCGVVVLTVAFSVAATAQAADATPAGMAAAQSGSAEPLFATVNGKNITLREFHAAYGNYLRQKFYHGQVPEQQLLEAKNEVSTRLVESILFREEIQRRNVQPDTEEVEKQLVSYDLRYANSPAWQQNRETVLPGLRGNLNEQSQLQRLEQGVRNLPMPSSDEARKFYDTRPELFTEPEKIHLHTILLHVDPSSAGTVWQAARDEATQIVKRLRAGANFEESARMHSRDKSADGGGDMGYLHRGMMPDILHEKIDQMKVGDISDPIDVLEGVAVFRLNDRKIAKLRAYSDVAERARDLLQRERQEQAWKEFRETLRTKADIKYHEMPAAKSK